MIAKKIHDIASSIGDPELADKIIKECNNGDAFLFSFNDCFVVLKVRTIDECLCVQIECAYSERKNGFMFGYSFVSARAAEIGAKYITFSTANKALEKMAANCGWAKLEQGELLSSWIIEL